MVNFFKSISNVGYPRMSRRILGRRVVTEQNVLSKHNQDWRLQSDRMMQITDWNEYNKVRIQERWPLLRSNRNFAVYYKKRNGRRIPAGGKLIWRPTWVRLEAIKNCTEAAIRFFNRRRGKRAPLGEWNPDDGLYNFGVLRILKTKFIRVVRKKKDKYVEFYLVEWQPTYLRRGDFHHFPAYKPKLMEAYKAAMRRYMLRGRHRLFNRRQRRDRARAGLQVGAPPIQAPMDPIVAAEVQNNIDQNAPAVVDLNLPKVREPEDLNNPDQNGLQNDEPAGLLSGLPVDNEAEDQFGQNNPELVGPERKKAKLVLELPEVNQPDAQQDLDIPVKNGPQNPQGQLVKDLEENNEPEAELGLNNRGENAPPNEQEELEDESDEPGNLIIDLSGEESLDDQPDQENPLVIEQQSVQSNPEAAAEANGEPIGQVHQVTAPMVEQPTVPQVDQQTGQSMPIDIAQPVEVPDQPDNEQIAPGVPEHLINEFEYAVRQYFHHIPDGEIDIIVYDQEALERAMHYYRNRGYYEHSDRYDEDDLPDEEFIIPEVF